MGPLDYGTKYWCIKVPPEISEDGEIYVYGDKVSITETGALLVTRYKEDFDQVNLSLAPGNWTVVFAASVMDGSAVAVEHWTGEVVRS